MSLKPYRVSTHRKNTAYVSMSPEYAEEIVSVAALCSDSIFERVGYMNNNIDKKLQDVLNGIDKSKIRQVEQFLNTPDGEKIKQKLNGTDKNKIINAFMNMDTNELKKKLSGADFSKINPKNIIDKLK